MYHCMNMRMRTRENRKGIKKSHTKQRTKSRERNISIPSYRIVDTCTAYAHQTHTNMHSHINKHQIKTARITYNQIFYNIFGRSSIPKFVFSDVSHWIVVITTTVDHHFLCVYLCVHIPAVFMLNWPDVEKKDDKQMDHLKNCFNISVEMFTLCDVSNWKKGF